MPREISFMCSAFDGIRGLVRGSNDPVDVASEALGATKVSPREFTMLHGARGLEAPIAGASDEVREILDRPTNNSKYHWRTSARLGPFASSEGTNSMRTPSPATHRVGVREVLDALSVPGQVGYPSSMNTDDYLGYSVMG